MSDPAVATDPPSRTRAARLADYTTLRVGGPAADFVEADTEQELLDAVTGADAAGTAVFVLGGGSNVLVGDDGFDGRVVAVRTRGVQAHVDDCSGATVTVAAGESWDGFVARCVHEGWLGVEALTGIPGLVGATPIQNVGAYGQEVRDTIARVRTYDRQTRTQCTFAAADCGFGYRSSRFKAEPDRYLVLDVTFQLRLGQLSGPIGYAELARRLDVPVGGRAAAADVAAAVYAIRTGKGMVLDPADHDTWSAGSFFTNPVLAPAQVPSGAPTFPVRDRADLDGSAPVRVKTSAAWLIEHAGFTRGYGDGPARLSTKHTLALTNRGDAQAADLLALARHLKAGVRARFGIDLEPEPVLVGCRL